ncbi:CDP-glycerol glycerophosphotransferase family protein [Latilactobacillus sakei]|uniref:CDP-glycerol glycerophosphotransferase family protein n=1 Tax=Latilactobacillus sakei TaxID=1599 RepID=UPI00202F1044|nr:CDP-glycerol glycerophosphotransferase family protein [Latilactobacillus sakei]MCM1636034.1 CDP-glycerol glycerophosphotransferase family protein [Latilactobacillus sakei]USF97707.1 hypothetical protein A4W81_01740 [Latilactobacillus sakei]
MKLVFSSFPEVSDNTLIVLTEIINQELPVKCYWLVNDMTNLDDIKEKLAYYLGFRSDQVTLVPKKSLSGLFHYLTANYSFGTHGMFEQFPLLPWQKKVNLWHGMPLKKIGRLSGNPVKFKISYTVSTAPVFDAVIAESFEINDNQIVKVGLPRNDLFFKNRINPQITQLFNNDYPLIAWLPTYRQSAVGDIRVDGVQMDQNIGGLNIPDLIELNQALLTNKKNLIIKLHPMDTLNEQLTTLPKFKNIKLLNSDGFNALHIEVNDFLRHTIGLVTDYSSVYFDYLLMEKPIGIFQFDESSYSEKRGFTSDEVADNFTGFKISNLSDFESFIKNIESEALHEDLIKKNKLFNRYDTAGNNSATLLKKIGLLKYSEGLK